MTEQDLIDLGFERVEKLDDDVTFHYYCYDISGKGGPTTLITKSK